MEEPERLSVTLHSTWRGLLSGGISGGLLAAAGTWAVAVAGFNLISTAVFVFGWLLLLIVLFDLPVSATFDCEGVERRMPLRRQRLEFDERSVLTRVRPSPMRFRKGRERGGWAASSAGHLRPDAAVSDGRDRGGLEHGGLVLVQGRRKYLLVDRAESRDEYLQLDEVVDVEGTPGAEVGMAELPIPSESTSPTWLYRRAKWRPDWAARR